MGKLFTSTALAGALILTGLSAQAADQDQDRTRAQDQTQTRDQIRDQDIYGHNLMTVQERNEYRNRMRTANTAEERERIRAEHHAQMQIRAKEKGMMLPDEPPAGRGPGMGPGGGGMGPGGGMRR